MPRAGASVVGHGESFRGFGHFSDLDRYGHRGSFIRCYTSPAPCRLKVLNSSILFAYAYTLERLLTSPSLDVVGLMGETGGGRRGGV